MLLHVSKKEMNNNLGNEKIYKVGYCGLQFLLNYKDRFAYSSRREGWACDYYLISDKVIISTGYSPTGLQVNYDISKKYDDKARTIINDYNIEYKNKVKKIDKLIQKFIEEIAE